MDRMHDWTLLSVSFEWRSASASLEFEDTDAKKRTLMAEQVRLLEVPRENEWGPSVSVNATVEEPGPNGAGRMLRVEMQTGDVIRVWAAKVVMS
ncbi:MAG: hypothetical protein Q8L92_03345 [Rubrivivax sp.]|nr:hypothetical protein [Rubrivivax sp.]